MTAREFIGWQDWEGGLEELLRHGIEDEFDDPDLQARFQNVKDAFVLWTRISDAFMEDIELVVNREADADND